MAAQNTFFDVVAPEFMIGVYYIYAQSLYEFLSKGNDPSIFY